MDDRKLLELAAKAAGISITFGHLGYGPYHDPLPDVADQQMWNPLTDDGDALRLAVKLNIEISPCPDHDSVCCEPKGNPDSIVTVEALDDFGTRRAIVRAAAEIGMAMP